MNTRTILAKQEINDAYQTMGGIVTDGGTGSGTGTGGGAIWGSSGFWGSVNHLFDTIGGMFGRPNYGNYPPQYSQGPAISPTLTYAAIGLFLLIALALVFKIIK